MMGFIVTTDHFDNPLTINEDSLLSGEGNPLEWFDTCFTVFQTSEAAQEYVDETVLYRQEKGFLDHGPYLITPVEVK